MAANRTRKSDNRDVNYDLPSIQADDAKLLRLLSFFPRKEPSDPGAFYDKTLLKSFEKYGPYGDGNQLTARGLSNIRVLADEDLVAPQRMTAANFPLPKIEKNGPLDEDLFPHLKALPEIASHSDAGRLKHPEFPKKNSFFKWLERLSDNITPKSKKWLGADVPAEELAVVQSKPSDSSSQPVAASNDDAAGLAERTQRSIKNESEENEFITVTVSRGDTLSKIAKRNGTTVANIMRDNKDIAKANRIYEGQKIKILKTVKKTPINVAARDGATVESVSEERGEAMDRVRSRSDEVASGSKTKASPVQSGSSAGETKEDIKSSLRKKLVQYEDRIPHMYLDSKGYVTIGVGHMIKDAEAAKKLVLYNRETNKRATSAEIEAEFSNLIKHRSAKNNYRANYYKQFTKLEMRPEDINNLTDKHIESFGKELRSIYPEFDTFPEAARLGLFDMIFNLGMTKLSSKKMWPSFNKAVESKDWPMAAKESSRKDIRPERNEYVKNLFLNAARSSNPNL